MSLDTSIGSHYTLSTLKGVCECAPKNLSFEVNPKQDEMGTWYGKAVSLSNVKSPQIVLNAFFSDLRSCESKSIIATGTVYVHECPTEIDSIVAGGDVILYKWMNVNSIVAKGDVYLIRHDYEARTVFKNISTLGEITSVFLTNRTDKKIEVKENKNADGSINGRAEIWLK